jgi:hypothetical protein
MPLYKFGAGDVFYNQIKTHPSSSFYIYSGSVYYRNKATEPGSFAANATNVPVGHVSLFELNIDRAANGDATAVVGPSSSVNPTHNVKDTGFIYPFVYKGVQSLAFKDIKRDNYIHDYVSGSVITGSYMMSASLTRLMFKSDAGFNDANIYGGALKNSLDYARRHGDHYKFVSGSSANQTTVINIPSVFYGSEIKKGTVDLKYYISGTLVARARDTNYNGALLQSSGGVDFASGMDGTTVGVVLYKEGIIVLTASHKLTGDTISFKSYSNRDNTTLATVNNATTTTWQHFGLMLPQGSGSALIYDHAGQQDFANSASFELDFAGTHYVPSVTMLAHANRGELNYSNNPTYIKYGQTTTYNPVTGTMFYGERELEIKNIHSASYADPTGSLKKTTYITKVGIYDEKKNLIGIASVAKPVKKTEERDLTFKLKLDI